MLQADSVVLELEDGVALTMKTQARNNAVKWLTKGQQRPTHCEYGLRMNSISSRLIDDDLNVRIPVFHDDDCSRRLRME